MPELHGFELIETRHVPESDTEVRLYRHIKTGAEVLSCVNDDENKSFGVAFQTPPPDSTGLPHILEHSVLAGSRKYPVKEPFVELIKTSLNTFINAMTFPDMTIYPVASTNVQDFYNLVDVYLDAVFYPLITPETMMQEGWHLDTKKAEDPVNIVGVVYNEMKGYYSVPEILLDQYVRETLMPDTPYRHDYGGNPANIPELTYEQFKTFHETYYHPSNARIFFYGDDNPEQRLALLDEYLRDFDRIEIDATLPLQPRFSEPVNVTMQYDGGDKDENDDNTYVATAWLLDEVTDVEKNLAFGILEHILIGTPASPLRKALIDSGLGEDLTGAGFEREARESRFEVGLKGAKRSDAKKIETLINQTLGELAENGINKETVAASLNTVEFSMRERNSGRFPRGLVTMINILPTWLHGGNPIDAVAFEKYLESIKQAYADDPNYFENLIGKYLIDNPHRITLTLEPNPAVAEERDQREKAWLDEQNANMSEDDIANIVETSLNLQSLQQAEDSPEDLAKIPTLTIDDIDREIKTTPIEVIDYNGANIYYHDLPTSGIAYIDIGFDLTTLPQEYVPYLSLFGQALTELGTKTQDFVELSNRIGKETGGIGDTVFSTTKYQSKDYIAYLMLKSKVMVSNTDKLFAIFNDILLTTKFDNKDRFKQMVLEAKAGAEGFLGLRGHMLSNLRLRARFDMAGWIDEQLSGVSQIEFLRQLAEDIDSKWDEVYATLTSIRDTLFNRHAMIVNVTLGNEQWANVQPQLNSFLDALPANDVTRAEWQLTEMLSHEGLGVATMVNFVGKGANLYDEGYELNGSHVVILKNMNLTYMWNNIRVQGGAYGGACVFNSVNGVVTYLSWQDPNNVKTLNTYDNAGEFLRTVEFSETEMEQAIIGAIGQMDAYMLPDAKGYQSTIRHLIGYTDEMRQQLRDEVLATTIEDFRAFADVLDKVASNGHVVLTSSEEKIDEANEELDPKLTFTKIQ